MINLLYNELAKIYNQKGKSRNGLKRVKANLFIGYNELTKVYFVQYHATRIIKIDYSGTCFLNNGDWYTMSTKKHMNSFLSLLGVYVRQFKGSWIIEKSFNENGLRTVKQFHYYNEMNVKTLGQSPLDLRIGV